MHLIKALSETPLDPCDQPVRMTAASCVAAVETDLPVFMLSIFHIPFQGAPLLDLTVRCNVPVHHPCNRPSKRLPQRDKIVAVTGNCISVENSIIELSVLNVYPLNCN
jgi:hypothetical protein